MRDCRYSGQQEAGRAGIDEGIEKGRFLGEKGCHLFNQSMSGVVALEMMFLQYSSCTFTRCRTRMGKQC